MRDPYVCGGGLTHRFTELVKATIYATGLPYLFRIGNTSKNTAASAVKDSPQDFSKPWTATDERIFERSRSINPLTGLPKYLD